ncbi:hypothetical protein TOPH_08548 [Tolypocladium ophioglossoides CBS 100239]|uniref:N-acetyltransferase ESCO zinc-finger domain-containing protein n=1 Tax=Tolypocladium ophioglossoides (strain CBS 100239) TaxID=1163406 RepID=A0A0L0MYF4_TOLOC|nr:hypothetical protein TOPH_08548 [Tolypocladium ophioglossoides CBS 100239]
MPNSSPEYAITKPGMAHMPSRKRDKPMRTYGKRSISTPEPRGEPPSKRVRLGADEPAPDGNPLAPAQFESPTKDRVSGQVQKDHEGLVRSDQGEAPKPSSILSYFKPVPPRALAVSSIDTIELPRDPDPSRLSSSTNRPKRKPRLLGLRATSSPLSDAPEDPTDGRDDTSKSKGDGHDKGADRGSSKRDRSSPLCDGTDNRLNQTKRGTISDETKPGGTTKTKKAPAVQTTLNLSAQAAFAECKVCDTVWNPLYPDDVKYHSKRHATVMRAKRKQEDGL